jgi:eukaryotic-like serine/threonine-protein kinase
MVMTHPFGRQKLTAASSVSTPRHTTAPRSPASPSAGPSVTPSADPSASPATQSPATQQQAAVNLAALLAQSVSDRAAVNAAYNDVNQCGPSLTQDVQTFQTAAASHRQLLRELATMPGRSALPQAMVQDLRTAWQASTSADDDFAKWAQDQVTNECSPADQSDPNYMAADGPDVQATQSKTAFAQLWNPLAQAYGLKTYSQGDL